jgi:hypothetical protein
VVGGDPDVGDALLEHAADRSDHAANRGDLTSLGVLGGRQRVEVAEELVGAVD